MTIDFAPPFLRYSLQKSFEMQAFFRMAFGPTDMATIAEALSIWRDRNSLPDDHPDAEIAAAVALNLYREGKMTPTSLAAAIMDHKALSDLTPGTTPKGR